jgi:hypothetical protein
VTGRCSRRCDVPRGAAVERNRPGMEQIAGYLEQKRRQSERKSCLLERAWNGPSPCLGSRGTGRPAGRWNCRQRGSAATSGAGGSSSATHGSAGVSPALWSGRTRAYGCTGLRGSRHHEWRGARGSVGLKPAFRAITQAPSTPRAACPSIGFRSHAATATALRRPEADRAAMQGEPLHRDRSCAAGVEALKTGTVASTSRTASPGSAARHFAVPVAFPVSNG